MASKNSRLLVFILGVAFFASGCSFFSAHSGSPQSNKNAIVSEKSKNYKAPKRIAEIEDEAVRESSGLVASRRNQNAFWTHNDSGDGAFLYAFDRAGKKLGTWKVSGAKNVDWEDLAIFVDRNGESYLLIGDIGNNALKRAELVIYKVREPQITASDAASDKKNPRATEQAQAISVKYPDEPHNAETLLVHPETGDLYVVSKDPIGEAGVYKLSAPFSTDKTNALTKVAKFGVPSLTPGVLTGGEIAPDGKKLILCDYFAAYELELSSKAKNFDEIWKAAAQSIDLGERAQGEAICYRPDGRAILATSENRPTPLIEVERK